MVRGYVVIYVLFLFFLNVQHFGMYFCALNMLYQYIIIIILLL